MSDGDIRRRVLVVDDDRITRETLAFIFAQHGYETKYAQSAEAAILVAGEWAPDFAVIDVMLPGIDGISLAIAINVRFPDCIVYRRYLVSGRDDVKESQS